MGIYIHIPFCVSKCIYCDFLSFAADDDVKRHYVDSLCREILGRNDKGVVTSIFFGGGTPSILPACEIGRILRTIRSCYEVAESAEITIECNPGTLTEEKLSAYRSFGINRLSIGLQSPDDAELRRLGRIHTYREFEESYTLARNAGFDNINIDIMSAIPFQTLKGYEDNLKKVAALKPEHISAYSLIVEENTPLYDMVHNTNDIVLPDEETDRLMYVMTKEYLATLGYRRYEISNYSLEGHECRHNTLYWRRGNYIGFGLGASSMMDDVRFTNTSSMKDYLENPCFNYSSKTELTVKDRMEEFVFLGLRLTSGILKSEFYEEFGENFDDVYGEVAGKHTDNGLLISEGDRLYLSDAGLDVSNYVMSDFIFD